MMNRKSAMIALLGSTLLASAAFAQAPSASPASPVNPAENVDAADEGGIETITVTAQRREQNLQDVPIAVSAFTANELQARQVTRTLDLLAYVPNLQGHNNTGLGTANSYTLRALGNTESIATFDPPVGTYVDDIYISRQNSNNFQFFDVDRIEVLRGPQGTLFGRNTTGGAINVILKKPSDHVTGYIEAGFGKYDRIQTRASVDLPLSDKILTKVSAYYVTDDGYLRNQVTGDKLNDETSYGLRAAVRFLPTDTITWDLSGDYTYSSITNLVHFAPVGSNKRVNYTRLRKGQPLGALGNIVSPRLLDNTLGNTASNYAATSNLQFELGDAATVNVITGYRRLFQEFITDSADGRTPTTVVYQPPYNLRLSSPGTPGNVTPLANDGYHRQFSQEVKINGKALDNRLNYTGGLYYIKEKNSTYFANINLPVTGAAAATVTQDRAMFNNTTAYAGYVQLDFEFVDGLTATAGVRYTDEKKTIAYAPLPNPLPRAPTGTPVSTNQPFNTASLQALGIPISQRAKVWTPRFALNYEVTPDISVFASATKGFKSGGWNARGNNAAQVQPFGRETVWSYEGGLRSEFFNRRARVNLTGFYSEVSDFQLPAGGFNVVTQVIDFLTRNFSDLRNYGLEGEVTVVPVERLNIFWGFGLQKARYRNVNAVILTQAANCRAALALGQPGTGLCNNGIVTPTGAIAKPVRAPSFSSTLGINYTFELGGGYELSPSGAWQFVKANWVGTQNNVFGRQRTHDVFNAGLTLRDTNSGFSLTAECTNCTNVLYKTSFLIYSYLNEPVRWMVRGRYAF